MSGNEWLSSLNIYAAAEIRKSVVQLSISLGAYAALITAMFVLSAYGVPYYYTLLLALPAAGFQLKLFIILHDCSHNSFFRSTLACSIVGTICGIITFTPFFDWQRSHAIHHASVSNLDKRGTGDVWTMTVEEYNSSRVPVKALYRLFRNPLFLFSIAPPFLFLIVYRLPHSKMRRKDLFSILFTDAALVLAAGAAYCTVGLVSFAKVIIVVTSIASILGMWLFYIQHQFKNVYWSHSGKWDPVRAALEGSSFYNLPSVLRWFSGSIGYHHIHHLKPRIPNYNLRSCYSAIPEVRNVSPITLSLSLRSLFLYLWDEESSELVNFSAAKRLRFR